MDQFAHLEGIEAEGLEMKYSNSYVPLLFMHLCYINIHCNCISIKHNVSPNDVNVFCYLGTSHDNIAYVLNENSKVHDDYIEILNTLKKYDYVHWDKLSPNAKWVFFTQLKRDVEKLYVKYDGEQSKDWYAYEIETIIQNLQNNNIKEKLKFYFQPFEVDLLVDALLDRNKDEDVLNITPGTSALASKIIYVKNSKGTYVPAKSHILQNIPQSELADSMTRFISYTYPNYSSVKYIQKESVKHQKYVIGCNVANNAHANFGPFIMNALNHTKDGGWLVLTLPSTFLYNAESKPIRKYLLQNKLISAIVELPVDSFTVDTPNLILLSLSKPLANNALLKCNRIKIINATDLIYPRDTENDDFFYSMYRTDYETIETLINDDDYMEDHYHFEDRGNDLSSTDIKHLTEEFFHHLVHYVDVNDFINNDYNLNYKNVYTEGWQKICLRDALTYAPMAGNSGNGKGRFLGEMPKDLELSSSKIPVKTLGQNVRQMIRKDALLATSNNDIKPRIVRCNHDRVYISNKVFAYYPETFISIDTIQRSLLSDKFKHWHTPYPNLDIQLLTDRTGLMFRTIEKPILSKSRAEASEDEEDLTTLEGNEPEVVENVKTHGLKVSDKVLNKYLGTLDKSQRSAAEYVLGGHSVFITGKAGTGKSTLLHALEKLYRHLHKNVVVAAPTGVAARVAGGQTLHSLLHLPIAPYIPGMRLKGLFSLPEEGIYLVRHLDVLFIDEMSMVRSDLLDMIDVVLRHYRKSDAPFGGIQLVMLGDLYQLMPVVKEEDWQELKKVYKTSYFFSSKAYQKLDCSMVELTEIHRQNDTEFTTLLNNVREGHVSYNEMKILSSRYMEHFRTNDKSYIRLTTHNRRAERYNDSMMDELTSSSHLYKAKIEGYYPIDEYPTEEYLKLKVGARVMFIRNDNNGKLFVNGTLGTVIRLGDWEVGVKTDNGKIIDVERYSWDFMKYKMNKKTNEIEQMKVGTFMQYPLKLA